jgi:hypothetical protein
LKALDINKRPVHCSDIKREIMYIKEENKWEKENDERENLKKAIKKIAHQNILQIPSWINRYSTEVVSKNRAYGELGHPSGPSINLDRVSHIIVELKRSGKDFIGKAKLTETPMGNIAKGLLESGANLGVSSRGMGSLKESNGVMVVQSDYKIATAADIVADPSAPNAFVKGIMENVEWVYDPVKDTWFEEKLEETKKRIKRMTMNELEEKQLAIFEEYISCLMSKSKLL